MVAVTPIPPLNAQVSTGGTAVNAFGPNPNGGFLQNPASATDQALGAAEDLCVNPVGVAANPSGALNGTNFRIPPGGTWEVIAGQTTSTSINAASSGHKISGVSW